MLLPRGDQLGDSAHPAVKLAPGMAAMPAAAATWSSGRVGWEDVREEIQDATVGKDPPGGASASADINTSANAFTIARSRSGIADSRRSRNNAGTLTLDSAAIAVSPS
ncbi:hypothetical protein QLQ12_01645 [Actinoplanes sp. NEAU-A12]|uniref:Uncharacterized protein n=1 Tax=Actinoplanes sandaracinus TaxID=3045177 RepID=A0ABT6WC53_9ACTN|nr:hypothetical protein [Actinoplanes sandaracinus]MDI6097312.1 hypothetical protein [Actinoplanes sandaracinus]